MIKKFDIWQEHEFVCDCNMLHSMPIKEIVIAENAIDYLKNAPIKFHLGRNALVVLDKIVYEIVGEKIKETLEKSSCEVEFEIFTDFPVLPDERGLSKVLQKYSKDTDFFVAVGSGSINDITRYFSFKFNKPYISIPTAPSMDGYSASVSLLFLDGLKQTFQATSPLAIYADANILSNAPLKLIASGFGDLAAKISSCIDWKISSIVNNEYYCERTVNSLMDSIQSCIDNIDGLAKRDPKAVKILMEGLMISGIAMHWIGSSRPAAGAEHHITHFWGMQEGGPKHLHGIECAIGLLLVGDLYDYILKLDFKSIEVEKTAQKLSDGPKWKDDIQRVFKDKSEIIFSQNSAKSFDIEKIRQRILSIVENESAIKGVILERNNMMSNMKKYLEILGCPTTAKELGISPQMLSESLVWAKEVRNKYTIFDLAEDMGILEDYALRV